MEFRKAGVVFSNVLQAVDLFLLPTPTWILKRKLEKLEIKAAVLAA